MPEKMGRVRFRPQRRDELTELMRLETPPLAPGDSVRFLDTPATRAHCLAGGRGRVERVSGDSVSVIYLDSPFGPAGPYELSPNDLERA